MFETRLYLVLTVLLRCAFCVEEGPVPVAAGIAGEENATFTGELGRPLSVRCRAHGYPPPAVYWYRGRGGEMVPYNSALYEVRGQELHIRQLTMDTLGQYECQAYNGHSRAAVWRVLVRASRGQPKSPSVERDVTVPPYSYDTSAATTLESDFETPVQTSLPATTTVVPGTALSLPCEVDGYPQPEVRWTKNGAPLSSSSRLRITGSRLTIERAEASDSGAYSCHAANAYSSHSSTVRVTVQEVAIPASCVDNPHFANCALIVRSRFCEHRYYSKFCCKSCAEAGQLDPSALLLLRQQ